jgi:arsenate reductase
MLPKLKILFLCTGNSCRSQMAEGWARRLLGDRVEPHSAGVAPTTIDSRAVEVMQEIGLDLAGQRSKHLDDLSEIDFDIVVTVCDDASRHCPRFPGRTRTIHAGFDDPPRLARDARDEAEALGHYRRVRDQIGSYIRHLPRQIEALIHEQ